MKGPRPPWRSTPRSAARLAFALVALVVVVAGCGKSKEAEPAYAPASFIEAMNAEGAGLVLGPVLTVNPQGIDVNTVTFGHPPDVPAEELGEHAHSAGALVVLPGDEEADAEVQRCRVAPALTCFRVANAVIRFEDLSREDEARVRAAVTALGGDAG